MKRRAFTLIEIMVAIVILVILGGLMLYALKGTGSSAKSQATRVRLENLKSMLAEYELKTRLRAAPAGWNPTDTGWPWVAGDLWFTYAGAGQALPTPGNVRADLRGDWGNTHAALVASFVLQELRKIPSNASAWGKLPASEFIAGTELMADGWGNPLIFVPGTVGLLIDANGNSVADVGENIVHAPNNRPFWASAGPDGNFTNDDDNLYSFEQ